MFGFFKTQTFRDYKNAWLFLLPQRILTWYFALTIYASILNLKIIISNSNGHRKIHYFLPVNP